MLWAAHLERAWVLRVLELPWLCLRTLQPVVPWPVVRAWACRSLFGWRARPGSREVNPYRS